MSSVVIITIGVVFIFLIFSIAVSAIHEGITSLLAVRSKVLWTVLASFARQEGTEERAEPALTAKRFRSFFSPRSTPDAPSGPGAEFVRLVEEKTQRFASGEPAKKVKRVSAQVISQALIELGAARAEPDADGKVAIGPPGANESFLAEVEKAVEGSQLATAVKAARARAQGDIDKFAKAIEEWFDARMDALSRLYKAWTRWIMLVIALFVAFIADVNPIVAVAMLRNDSALAATTADAAAAFVEKTGLDFEDCPTISQATTTTTAPSTSTTTPLDRVRECYEQTQNAFAQSRDLPPPLNFDHLFKGEESVPYYIGGCLLGALAISFGAPFWYDLLRKLISLRS